MPISFGRKKQDESPDPVPMGPPKPAELNDHVLKDLKESSERSFTGALEVTERTFHGKARLYLFEGGLYAVHLEGYTPNLAARLQATGAMDEGRMEVLNHTPKPGLTAVQQRWISVDQLATLHQEYVLAALGAVLERDRVKVRSRKGEVTADLCTLPLPMDQLVESVRVRHQRMLATLGALGSGIDPASTVVRPSGTAIPSNLTLPEYAAMRAAIDGRRTLDEVAAACGFTRAEAVHLAWMLATGGVLTLAKGGDAAAPSDRLLVPEMFGMGAITPAPPPAAAAAVVAVVAVEPEVEADAEAQDAVEPDVALAIDAAVDGEPEAEAAPEPEAEVETQPEAEVEPETDAESEAAAKPESTPDAEAGTEAEEVEPAVEAEPEAEPGPEADEEPAPRPAAPRGPDEHVTLLRREIVQSEVSELRIALAEAKAAERDAIAHAAAVRARLQEAEDSLNELGGAADS